MSNSFEVRYVEITKFHKRNSASFAVDSQERMPTLQIKVYYEKQLKEK